MKLMKKLSALIALCLCLTVGGVYATWTYTQNVDVADPHTHFDIGLTGVAFADSYGTFDIDKSGLSIVVDPVSEGSHIAAIKITGQLVLKFTPNSHAPSEIKANGVPNSKFYLGTNVDVANWKYSGQQIFNVDTAQKDITWGTPDSNGVFTYVINANELASFITFANTFVLDTKGDYDAFGTALSAGQIGITVTDGLSTPNPALNN